MERRFLGKIGLGLPLFAQKNAVANIKPSSTFPRITHLLAVLVLFCLLGALFGSLLAVGIGLSKGMDYEEIMANLGADFSPENRGFVRLTIGLNHFFMFLVPALVTVWVFYKKEMVAYLRLRPAPKWAIVGLGILFLVVLMPAVQFSYFLNQQIPLPDWMHLMEASTADAIKNLLVMDSFWEFLANIVVIALLPAIGEELVFRGILQTQLMRRIQNPHVAIWLTGAVFSAIHFQFEGFLPRMLLGVALGYLFYWTKNLWIPIIAHFINNGVQVAAAYFYAEKMDVLDLEKEIDVPFYAAVSSILLAIVLGKKIWEMRPGEPVEFDEKADDKRISLNDFR